MLRTMQPRCAESGQPPPCRPFESSGGSFSALPSNKLLATEKILTERNRNHNHNHNPLLF